MNLTITESALEKIKEMNKGQQKHLLLFYDTEGCGCGVNGTPTLRLQEIKGERDVAVDCSQMKVMIHEQQATFFDKQMKLEFSNNMFRLSSPQGILNPFISPGVL